MKPTPSLGNETPEQTATPPDPVEDVSILKNARLLWLELQGLSHDYLHLAALETQRAGESLVAMIVAAVMMAVLLIAAWCGLMAVAVLSLMAHGLLVSSALLLVVAAHLGLVLLLSVVIRRKSRYLSFPALQRCLQLVSQASRKP